jgi:hypothetical protein
MPGAAVTAPPATLVSYLGHYVLARLVYDDLLRPLVRGDVSVALLLVVGATVAYALGRRSGRRPGRRP